MNNNTPSFVGGPSDQYRPEIIPTGWEWIPLSTVSRLESGHTPDRKEPSYWDGNIKWVSLQDTTRLEAPFINETAVSVTEEGIVNSSARILPAGTVIFSRTATVGKATILGSDMATSQDFANFICKDRIYNVYLMYALRGMGRTWANLMAGSTHNTIYMPDFKKLCLLLPSRAEQYKIAAVLSAWDRAIELTEKLIAAKQQRKRALMQQLLTGRTRLPSFSAAWETLKTGDIFKPVSTKNHPGERILSVTQDMGVVYRDEMDRKIGMNIDNTGGYKLVKAGDFIISLRSFQGGIEMSRVRGIVSPAYHVIHPVIEIDREFFRQYFKSTEFISRLAVAVIGIRDGKQISYEDFGFMKCHVPLLEEQKAIAAVLNTQDREIELHAQKLDALRRQKKGLMQQLLTGTVRVNVPAEVPEV